MKTERTSTTPTRLHNDTTLEIKNDINTLKALLTASKNTSRELKHSISEKQTSINNLYKQANTLHDSIKPTRDRSNEIGLALSKIKQKNIDPNEPLRLKNETLRPTNAGSIKLFFKSAGYKKQQQAALKLFGSEKDSHVSKQSLINLKALLLPKIDEADKKNKEIQQSITDLKNTVKALEQERINVKNNEINPCREGLKSLKKKQAALEHNKHNPHRTASTEKPIINKNSQKNIATVENFSFVYHTTYGCHKLNKLADAIFNNQNRTASPPAYINASDVYKEYNGRLGDNFTYKEWTDIKNETKAICKENMTELVIDAADAFYNSKTQPFTVFRGQGMTKTGFNRIKDDLNYTMKSNNRPVYQAKRFLSTSKCDAVAKSFARAQGNNIAVNFVITGYSAGHIVTRHGLCFENGKGGEQERLFSPHACFAVVKIEGNTVYMTEVARNDKANKIPY